MPPPRPRALGRGLSIFERDRILWPCCRSRPSRQVQRPRENMVWDTSVLVLIWKQLQQGSFRWPPTLCFQSRWDIRPTAGLPATQGCHLSSQR
jgi:hypothetical protein